MKEGKKKKGKGSCATTFAHSATNLLAPHSTGGVKLMSVLLLIDPTRGYTRTHSLPVRLPLGLLGKGIIGLWLWLDVGVTRPSVIWGRNLRRGSGTGKHYQLRVQDR